jgi:uncharacterized membrane protein
MESRAKAFGHPIHPMLVTFPAGLLVTSLTLDIAHAITGRSAFAVVSYWNIAIGIAMGLVAALFGLIDWLAIPVRTRARRVGLWHALGNVVVLSLFAAAWLARRATALHAGTSASLAMECVAGALFLVTAWLGGELVDRLGVGVDDGAHLDASSSFPLGASRARTVGRTTPVGEGPGPVGHRTSSR